MLIEKLLASADRVPDRIAAEDPTRGLSYANLVRLADVLRRRVERETRLDRVGIMLPSSVGFVGTLFGVLWAGRTAIPINFLLQPAELAGIVTDSGIDLVIAIRHFATLLAPLPVRSVFLDELPMRRAMVLERLRRRPAAPRVSPDDLAVILYTSGTSAQPKGVCLTQRNLAFDVDGCIAAAKLQAEHRFLGLLPLFHTFGLTALLLVPIALGATTYYLPRFSPHTVLQTVREQRLSVMMAVASVYQALVRQRSAAPADLASLEYLISGGEPLSDTVYAAMAERFGKTLVQGYGLTETSPVVSLDLPWSHRRGTVGRAIPGVEVTSHDDGGAALPAGDVGELYVRGPNVMRGYYKRPDETAAVMTSDGWFKTGDMGRIDGDGYIAITGRKKEMIIVGGENVFPREIEEVLDKHPSVAASAVVGVMDESRGEVAVAFVELKEGATFDEIGLRKFCREHLAQFKVPRDIRHIEKLPRNATGKILRRELKALI